MYGAVKLLGLAILAINVFEYGLACPFEQSDDESSRQRSLLQSPAPDGQPTRRCATTDLVRTRVMMSYLGSGHHITILGENPVR